MPIKLKRVYDVPEESDGTRVLVERLWPRGLTKEAAKVDMWLREAAPSNELRKWYGHDVSKWEEFRKRYHAELGENEDVIAPVLGLLNRGDVTFVFASREVKYNSAAALREYIEALTG